MKLDVQILNRDTSEKWPGTIFIRDSYHLNIFLRSSEGLIVWIGMIANTFEEATEIMRRYSERSDFLSASVERSE
jgi:hypothetical protein